MTAIAQLHAAAPAQTATRLELFHPGWYAAVMGTAIVGIVAYQEPGHIAVLSGLLRSTGVVMTALAALLAVGLGVPYLARLIRYPDAARRDFRNPLVGALYATFPAGLLVLAVAVAQVGPAVVTSDLALAVAGALAAIGIALAVVVSVAFTLSLFTAPGVDPASVNGAWFIPPVVMIIVPVALVPFVTRVGAANAGLVLGAGYAAWGVGLLLFVLVAAVLYGRLVTHPLPGVPLAPSLWIPLGPVGAGGLALVRLAQVGGPVWGDAASGVLALSTIAATALWGFGLWWLAVAVSLLVGYRRRGPLPFGIGWWAFTFPLGAFTALTVALARPWSAGVLEAIAALLFVGLLAAWLIVSAGTVRAVRSGAAWRR